jgi:acetyl-CoA acetyltransferase
MFSPGARNAMRAQHYLRKYGLAREAFWPVVSNQRRHANMRPDAMMHDKTLTVEDYRDSPWVAEPFRRFDYCMMNDGAAAFVITTDSRARDLPKRPVLVLGSGLAHAAEKSTRGSTDYESDLDVFIHAAREKAFGEAGIGRESVDVAEFYDPFSNYPIMQAEAYGYCGPGEGSDFYREGRGTLGGELPVNTHGGHLSWGYLQGYGPLLEGVRQLRGEGGATQVADAKIALVTGSGEGSAGSPAFGNLILGVD